MKWVGESKTCSRESVAKGLAKGCYNLNKSSGWFLTPLTLQTKLLEERSTWIYVNYLLSINKQHVHVQSPTYN